MNKISKMLPIRLESSTTEWTNIDLKHYSCDNCIETQTRKKRNKKTEYESKK